MKTLSNFSRWFSVTLQHWIYYSWILSWILSGGLQGAGKGTVLWEVIKILHLQKLSSFSSFPSTALQPKVTDPTTGTPRNAQILEWGSIRLKIMFVYLILSCPQSHLFLLLVGWFWWFFGVFVCLFGWFVLLVFFSFPHM